MNRYDVSIFAFLVLVFLTSCNPKSEKQNSPDNEVMVNWDEMDNFHLIMAECFHPYKDSSNLEPAKRLASEMANRADAWAASTLPDVFENDDMKATLNTLKVSAAQFAELVKSGDDEAITMSLTKIHDIFHHIQEEWYHAKNEAHEEKHHD